MSSENGNRATLRKAQLIVSMATFLGCRSLGISSLNLHTPMNVNVPVLMGIGLMCPSSITSSPNSRSFFLVVSVSSPMPTSYF